MSRTVPELLRIFRFGLVGMAASLVHLTTAAILLWAWPFLHEALVNLAAYLMAFSTSLLGHQRITFRRKARLLRFLLMSWCGLAINYLVLFTCLWLGIEGMLAIVTAVLIAAASSYIIARSWVFSVGHEA